MAGRSCEGILLSYRYVDLVSNQEDVSQWFLSLCEELELKGRIRVARDGINCTVGSDVNLHGTSVDTNCTLHQCLSALQIGGSLASLRIHIKAVRCHELFGDDIDFKLAASSGAASDQAAAETGFKSLSVSICEVSCLLPLDSSLLRQYVCMDASMHSIDGTGHHGLQKCTS